MTTASIKVGETYEVKLRSNPSTGYDWYLTHLPPELFLADADYIPSSHPGVGRPGTKAFIFVGAHAGTAHVQFEYVRPWELGSPVETKTVEITVTGTRIPIVVLYGPALQEAAATGDLAKLQELKAAGHKHLAEVKAGLDAIEAAISKK